MIQPDIDSTEVFESIKLGMDAHAKWYYVARQAMVRSLLSMHGIHVTGRWWKGKTWATITSEAPEWVIERLRVFSA